MKTTMLRASAALIVACTGMIGACSAASDGPGELVGDDGQHGDESGMSQAVTAPACANLSAPKLTRAKIDAAKGKDKYAVEIEWPARSGVEVAAEAGETPDGPWKRVLAFGDGRTGSGVAHVDKMLKDVYLRLSARNKKTCATPGAPVHLDKLDYADPAKWASGWLRVVSHVHSTLDVKADAGSPVHANRINWFNGCFDVAHNDAACQKLLLESFSETGLEWAMAAAKDKGIASVIVTDHDNVGLWYTDTYRKYDHANPKGPSVVHGLEWTSALGHLTVVGNFLPEIGRGASVYQPAIGKKSQTLIPLPPDVCDDTDENHDVNSPLFDGPDSPCKRADHRGHGDEPLSVAEAGKLISELKQRGALVYANHPTNESYVEPPMKWQLGNLERLDGVEINTPDPTFTNRNAPEWWRNKALSKGIRQIGIAGTDCHIGKDTYTGNTACATLHGLIDLSHLDSPYMWVKPLASTSATAPNAPALVTEALREGRVVAVQDIDPAVIVDLGTDVNADGLLDYVSGSTLPRCEQPGRDEFEIQVRVRPVQTHDYNVSVWKNGKETKILQDEQLKAGETWVGTTTFSRSADVKKGVPYGYVYVQVRENKTLMTDNDAGFSQPIFFEAKNSVGSACNTRDADGY